MPVGLGYWQLAGQGRSAAVRYIDDDTLLGSIWRTLRHGPVLARVVFGPPQTANGQTRRQWAHALQAQVQQFLQFGV